MRIVRVVHPLCVAAALGLGLGSAAPLVGAAHAAEPARDSGSAATVIRRGAPLAPADPVALAGVLARPEAYAGKTVTVEGKVRRACSHKGCWMELAESLDPADRGCRVTFKDYGFFVPTDSVGAAARVQGAVAVETVEAALVEHLEAEGATFARKNADGTATEVRLVATGVELRPASR